jgi:GNAT superfamily N-acetyltransferase
METVKVVEADLSDQAQQAAIVTLLDAYARDPMGNGAPLPADVRNRIIPGLREHPTTLIFIAYRGSDAAGLAVCFRGFSTFAAKPLINIHDLVVLPQHRGQGIGAALLEAAAGKGRAMGCCKLTLEALGNNHRALRLYEAKGFKQVTHLPEAGGAIFMSKIL